LEEAAAQRAGKTISLADAIPYGLGEVDRDAVDPCTRAWLDLLRINSPAFRSSEGRSWVKGTECRTYTGSIRSVCEASATFCTLSARDEIEARLTGRLQEEKQTEAAARQKSVQPMSVMPAPPSSANESDGCGELGVTHRSLSRRPPVQQSEKYAAIDKALKSVAESLPKTQEEVFKALDGRVAHAEAEPFKTARGWHAGFKKDSPRARSWLSKSWSRLGLPPFSRGPK
jgi:hypothetical protein